MVVGIGLDIVEVARIAKALRGSKSITERVFTPEEIRYCSDPLRESVGHLRRIEGSKVPPHHHPCHRLRRGMCRPRRLTR